MLLPWLWFACAREACDTWGYADRDGDGFGDAGAPLCLSAPGSVAAAGDCDDGDAGIAPGRAEVFSDGVDQDCDGTDADDFDQDGFPASEDCDDHAAEVFPSHVETPCDGRDEDCDGHDGTCSPGAGPR